MEKNGGKGSYEQWGGGAAPFHQAVYGGSDLYFPGSAYGMGGVGGGSNADRNESWGYSGFAPPPVSYSSDGNASTFHSAAPHYSPFLGDGGAWGALVPPHDPRPKDFYATSTAGYRLPDSYGGSLHDGLPLHSLSLGPTPPGPAPGSQQPPQDPPAPKPLTWADKVKSTPKEAAKGLKKIPIGGIGSARAKELAGAGGGQAVASSRSGTVPLGGGAPAPAARFVGAPQPLIPPAPPAPTQSQPPPEHQQHQHQPPPQQQHMPPQPPNFSQPPPNIFHPAPHPPPPPPSHNGWPPHFDPLHHPPHIPPPSHHLPHHLPHPHHFNGESKKMGGQHYGQVEEMGQGPGHGPGRNGPRRGGGPPAPLPPMPEYLPPPPPPVNQDSNFLQRLRKETNPAEFSLPTKGARYFVIKSYSEDDVHRSIKYGIWASTDHGNKRLDAAFKEREGKGPIYLFFSVNASGHFCGVAQMMSAIDYSKQSAVWAQDKWKGLFKVKWLYVKDVPNGQLRSIRLENNENKPVTNSRDTQEVLGEKGRSVLRIIHSFRHTTSLFDDFAHYEKRQQEEDERKVPYCPNP